MNPRWIEEMSWRMGEVYAAVTDRILINLAKYFPFIKNGKEPLELFQYQARMLAQMGKVNSETIEIIRQSLDGADQALREVLTEAILDALKDSEPALRKAAEAGILNGPGIVANISPNQMQAFQAFYRQSADKLNLVNTVMLESTQNVYQATVSDIVGKMAIIQRIERTQGILNEATGEVVTGVSSLNEAVRDAVSKMIDNGITGFIDAGDHHWSPEAYVTMDIRTTMANTARAATTERMQQFGVDLFQVSHHDGARPLCYPWQGKVISESGWRGEVEDDDGNKVHVYALEDTTYGEPAGLFGINCGHYKIPFIPGFSRLRPPEQNKEENDKEYEQSQQQRALERKLRAERRDLQVAKARNDPAEIEVAKAREKKAEDELVAFCDETGRARRRSREFTPIKAEWPD